MGETERCLDCQHFVQHYVKGYSAYFPAACGHCVCPERGEGEFPLQENCSHLQYGVRGEEDGNRIAAVLEQIAADLAAVKEYLVRGTLQKK